MQTEQLNGAVRNMKASKRGAIGQFASDLVTLGELQWEMFQTEATSDVRQLWLPIVGMLVAICLSLATLPVLLLAAAWLIHERWAWSMPESLGAIAGTTLMLAGLMLIVLRSRLSHLPPFFAQSRDEWKKNCAWAKSQLSSRSE